MIENDPNKDTISEKVTGALWDRIGGFFTAMWDKVFDVFIDKCGFIVKPFYKGVVTLLKAELYGEMKFMQDESIDDVVKLKTYNRLLEEMKGKPTGTNWLQTYILQIICSAKLLMGEADVVNKKLTRKFNKEYAPNPLDISMVLNLWYKNPELRDYLKDAAMENGFSESDVTNIFKSMRSILNTGEIKSLYLREDITQSERDALLEQNGFDKESIAELTKLYELIPPISDLIRFSVREAFYEDYSAKYGLDKEFPPEVATWSKKQGLSEQWSKMYWRSHWVLPSLLMGYEMLHRKIITEVELADLFKAQDIMPYWRDKLKAISYVPFTRVDVRRMYAAGVLPKEAVFTAYQDIGYDEEKATKMTEFTVAYTQEKDRDLTKSEVIDGFKKGILTEAETLDSLTNLGYGEDEVAFYISRALYDVGQKHKELSVSNIKRLYTKGIFTLNQTYDYLGRLNLPSQEMEYLIQEWDIDKEAKIRSFPLAELHKGFKRGIIDATEYKEQLSNIGYNTKYINWFVELYQGE